MVGVRSTRRRRRGHANTTLIAGGMVLGALVLRACIGAPHARHVVASQAPEHGHLGSSGEPIPGVAGRDVGPARPRDARPVHVSHESGETFGAGVASSVHVALGIPTDQDPSDDYLMDEGAFVVSYNPNRRAPNWVAWKLDAGDLGRAPRSDDFRPDSRLPPSFYRVTPHDYAHSGYDRGHMCPSADRTATRASNALTFVMSNMLPQVHELNTGPWEKLEREERSCAERSHALYIVAGGVFASSSPTIGHGVAVPRATFKIIVELDAGQTVSEVTRATHVVAVIMPNEVGVAAHDWGDYLTSVDRVEAETGYDFLSDISDPVELELESRVGTDL